MRGGHSLVGFREGSWEASLCLRQQRSLSQCRLLSSSLCCEHSWGSGKEIQSQNSLGKRLLDLVYACESQRFQTCVEICKCVPCGFDLCGRIGPCKRDAFTYLCLTALPAACERSYPGPLVVLVAEVTPNLYWMYLNFKFSSWTSPSGSHCCVAVFFTGNEIPFLKPKLSALSPWLLWPGLWLFLIWGPSLLSAYLPPAWTVPPGGQCSCLGLLVDPQCILPSGQITDRNIRFLLLSA